LTPIGWRTFRILIQVSIRTIHRPFFCFYDRPSLVVPIERQFIFPKSMFFIMPNLGFDEDMRVATRCQNRRVETPPRLRTASCNPPPTETMSRRNRNVSKRFDFPEAFGPIRKTRLDKATSRWVKLRQFFSSIRMNLIEDARLDSLIPEYPQKTNILLLF
jgi:hypothetical protein